MLIRKMENRDISTVCKLMYQLTGHEISENDMKNRLEYETTVLLMKSMYTKVMDQFMVF
jgi:hypothetical protein